MESTCCVYVPLLIFSFLAFIVQSPKNQKVKTGYEFNSLGIMVARNRSSASW